MWQDKLIMAGNFILAGALIPSILTANKPDILTSAVTAIVLASFAVSFFTLKLKLSALAVGTACLFWTVLLVQVLINNLS